MSGTRASVRLGWRAVIVVSVASVAGADDVRLADAIRHNLPARVQALLAEKIDVNARLGDGSTALHWAVHWDEVKTAERLLQAGANVKATTDLGVTPLLIASANRNVSMALMLLKSGADSNAASIAGETPIMRASRTGSVDVVKALLVKGANPNAKELSRGQTALMWAVAQGHSEVVDLLLLNGADVHARSKVRPTLVNLGAGGRDEQGTWVDEGGSTPLLFAARVGDVKSARRLVDAGASPQESGADGASALVVAAHSGHGSLAKFLLDKGADPNAAGAGYTALHAAVLRGDVGLMEALLTHGANANAPLTKGTPLRRNGQDFVLPGVLVGATPIWLAAKFVEVEAVRLLASHGADPHYKTNDGATTLMMAVGKGTAEDANRRGVTAIDGGALEEEGRVIEAVSALLALGVDVNTTDNGGDTALHAAASQGYDRVIQLLADRGARLSARNRDGHTPLSLISAGPRAGTVYGTRDLKSTVELLRRLGAEE